MPYARHRYEEEGPRVLLEAIAQQEQGHEKLLEILRQKLCEVEK